VKSINLPDNIDSVIFDLDGVIRHWDNSELFQLEQENSLEEGFLFRYAFEKELLKKAVTGVLSHEEWTRHIYELLLSDINEDLARQLLETWDKSTFRIDEELLNQFRGEHPSASFYLLTNATTCLDEDLKGTKVPGYFDEIFNTSEIGMAKPDEGIFTYVLNEIGASSERCLLIDDSEVNCGVAGRLGFWFRLVRGCVPRGCSSDEGRPLGIAVEAEIPNNLKLLC
jgi:putative hydrolase of the HAD superfamily